MKTKGGSLYEVLKSASRPSGADEGAPTSPEPPAMTASEGPQPTLQERLAAYKAAKLAAVTSPGPAAPAAFETAPSRPEPAKPSSATLILEPDPTPIPAPSVTRVAPPPAPAPSMAEPTPAAEPPPRGPGERVVKLTYNTVLFGGMVAVGLLFIAYAVGLHVGKGNAAAEFQAAAAETARPAVKPVAVIVPAPPPQPLPPPAPKKEYTIRLGEWKFVTAQDRLKALALADDPDLKKALERSGHRSFEKTLLQRGTLALYVDSFTDIGSDGAKSALTAMKTFKWKSQTPFAQAAFEEKQPK